MQVNRGFILVVVLWTLLALSVSVSALALWVSRSTVHAVQQSDERRAQVARFSTLETLKFLLATRPPRASGLFLGSNPHELAQAWRNAPLTNNRVASNRSDLHFDGTVYRGLEDTLFDIQDEAGLLGLNLFASDSLEGLLGQAGVPRTRRGRLVERLRDYIDFLPNPSRDAEYRVSDLPQPPQRSLLSSLEVRNILDWRSEQALWDRLDWAGYTSTVVGGSINLNTAPEELLSSLPEIGPGRAELLSEARRQRSVTSVEAAARLLGSRLDPFSYRVLPSEVLRITLGDRFTERSLRYTVGLTGTSVDRHYGASKPWRIELVHPWPGADLDPTSAQNVEQSLLAPTQESGG